MKIRNGFVSNSSSSSFCIYGACVEFDSSLNNILNILKKIQEIKPDEYKNWINEKIIEAKKYKIDTEVEMYEFLLNVSDKTKKEFMKLEINKEEESEDEISYSLEENLINLLEFVGLYSCSDSNGNFFVGRRYENLGDSETGKQFRDSTQEIIKKLFNKKCSHIEEIIYD